MAHEVARVPKAATLGLFGAWLVHDLEELATMPIWAGVSREHAAVAIGLMGGVVAAASVAGAVTGGRSRFYQSALTGFGAHGWVHLAASAATRGYAPGVATSPLVVIPFAAWARKRLRAAGIEPETSWAGLALLPVLLGAVHGTAVLVTRGTKARRASLTR
ncbi:HXXEE domain-containing protein [Amycolatopsis sp. YIM 10]|uniref:HXXEE domain-containing protein n=1 Tax=Amycolatopsis sp. YIM 10 TaxID=2653857 RepID=UPI00128FE41A|nr:HXXEE domain-containing protein [Amycolatopsis sp. YIM 10]QFU87675.1 hypothetical protein YIM_12435 [Amycolatopsis sp. YIM 10]